MTETNQPHDAQKTLADLRDHLARHDKPIAFLFGAGASCAVRVALPGDDGGTAPIIPAVAGLTELCKRDAGKLGPEYAEAWDLVATQCAENNLDPNVENILSQLRMMLAAVGQSDTLAGLNKEELRKLEKSVREVCGTELREVCGTELA